MCGVTKMKHNFYLESSGWYWNSQKGGWLKGKKGTTYWSKWNTADKFFKLRKEHETLYGLGETNY